MGTTKRREHIEIRMADGGSDDTGACDHYIVGRAFITVDNVNIMNLDPLGYAVGIKNKSAVNGSSVEPSDRIYLWLLHLATPICVYRVLRSVQRQFHGGMF